jgi:glutathione S-transferase
MFESRSGQGQGLPVLYSFRRCPYAMRARLAIVACGLVVEMREVALRNKPPELLALSPKATVPVLSLPNGLVIEQSLDIMRWALEQHEPETWMVLSDAQRLQGEAWLDLLDGPFKFNLDRYKYPNRYEDCDPLPHRSACVKAFLEWEVQLSQMRAEFLFGPLPCLYDYAILPFVRQFRIADEAWFDEQTDFPKVQAWLHRFMVSALFDQVMVRVDPWQAGDAPLLFPSPLP